MKDVTMIPIFPLRVVLLPDTDLPLHIFEDRYKKMVNRCIEEDLEFGIVYSDGTEIQQVGCTAKISKVIKRYDDGRMDILTTGNQRFYVKELSEEEPYLQASVDYFDDEIEPETQEMIDAARRGVELMDQIEEVSSLSKRKDDLTELNLKVLSFIIANAPGVPDYRRQDFLEMTDTRERLFEGIRELEGIIKNMQLVSQLEKVITMPDKVHGFYVN
jgi:ATP-dependent Lon protease